MSLMLATISLGPKEIPFWDFTDKEFFTKLEGLVARDSQESHELHGSTKD